ncbi:MAG: hypothetical protein J6D08_13320 [Lachnospiraceae bacterium]|nr:hypothetical protein [Lachnospiraceae bacterium]
MKRKYMTLTSQKGNPIPQVVNWHEKLDVRKMNRNEYERIPGNLLLEMRTGMDVVYPDIMTEPVLMVSEEAMEVIRLYDGQMPFIFLVLFDAEKEESIPYYCPVLKEGAEAEGEVLYRLKKPDGYEIRICEELAESLLERGAVGMELSLQTS